MTIITLHKFDGIKWENQSNVNYEYKIDDKKYSIETG